MHLIETLNELRKVAEHEPIDCFIQLNGGLRSSKEVFFDLTEDKFNITNAIDGTIQTLTEKELFTKSNIGEAVKGNAFYMY